jgi:hypothetical protein
MSQLPAYLQKRQEKKAAAANVQCQRCLKLGHYTFECKLKEAVYVARPSHTKLLVHPSLRPRNVEKDPDTLREEAQRAALEEYKKKKAQEKQKVKEKERRRAEKEKEKSRGRSKKRRSAR